MKIQHRHQEWEGYNQKIKTYGCYFLDLLVLACELKGIEIEDTEVEDYYTIFLKKGFMNENCFILNPNKILEYFGIKIDTRKSFKLENETQIDTLKYCIVEIQLATSNHFILAKINFKTKEAVPYWDSLFLKTNLNFTSFRIFDIM